MRVRSIYIGISRMPPLYSVMCNGVSRKFPYMLYVRYTMYKCMCVWNKGLVGSKPKSI